MPIFPLLGVLLILEIVVWVVMVQAVGFWATLGLVVLGSAIGMWLMRREGAKAFEALQLAANERRSPRREAVDGALVAVGGAFMLIPGLVSDVLGLLFLLPFTRPAVRGLVLSVVARRARRAPQAARIRVTGVPSEPLRGEATRADRPDGHPVIEGEIVDP